MKKINWKTEKRKVKELIPADYNPRKMTEIEKQDLVNSITEFGAVVPVVINLDNKIIGGHQRLSIYADLQYEEVDVMVPNRQLELEEEMRLNLRLNKNTGSWDWDKMKDFDNNLLIDIGFTDEELKMNFGLSDAEIQDVDESRMDILQVLPPESPKLKERAQIHFSDIKDYFKVKKAIEEKIITGVEILSLLKKK